MAWNVVIAGGGFGGAMAARELERILPRQSTRLTLVNDVNFMLYTPFLPEAAAGTLEPRHVVTPLREILKRTYLRLDRSWPRPAAKTVDLRTHDGDVEEVPYDQLLLALGSVSRVLPVPGLSEHAIGFKSLADAIWLRNHVIETLEAANATEDPARRDELLTYVFVGGGYAGLEALAELQDFAADAIESYPRARLHGMRWVLVEASDRVLPEIDAELAEYALRELRGRGIDIRLEHDLGGGDGADSARLSTGEALATRTVVWTAGVAPHPSLKRPHVPLDERGRVPVDEHLRVEGMDSVWAIGDCAAAPDPRGGTCPPTAQHAVRQGPVAARNIAAELGIGAPRAVRIPRQRGLRQPRPLQGGGQDRRPHLPRLPGLVDGPHLPHEPDPGRRPQGPRGDRLDRQPAVPPRPLRGRLDRPPEAPGRAMEAWDTNTSSSLSPSASPPGSSAGARAARSGSGS